MTFSVEADCKRPGIVKKIDGSRLWSDFSHLASDKMQGRKPGTPGHERAQVFLISAFKQAGFSSFNTQYRHPFDVKGYQGTNLIAYIPGQSENAIVLTAHYDHLGIKGRRIYNGADDNASGVAAMLEIGRQVLAQPIEHTLILVATDQEEKGLYGARAFLQKPPVLLEHIKLNVNLDMIAQDRNKRRLYIAGARRNPNLKPVVESGIKHSTLCLKTGHDGVGFNYDRSARINWRKASDHYPFLKAGIPYLFFSVSDHKYYHTHKDQVEQVDQGFYMEATQTILTILRHADKHLLPSQYR